MLLKFCATLQKGIFFHSQHKVKISKTGFVQDNIQLILVHVKWSALLFRSDLCCTNLFLKMTLALGGTKCFNVLYIRKLANTPFPPQNPTTTMNCFQKGKHKT